MALPLIIARSFRDAHAFAKDKLGLRVGHYRVVNSPGTIKATRGANVYLVPGWDKGPGHFAMQTALRYCHHNIIDGSTVGMEETSKPTEIVINVVPDHTPVPEHHAAMVARVLPDETEQILSDPEAMAAIEEAEAQVAQDDEPSGPAPKETDFFDTIESYEEPTSTCVDCGLDPHDPECISKPDPEPTPEPETSEEKPKARRRSRCKDCEQLHYKDEPCPTGGE